MKENDEEARKKENPIKKQVLIVNICILNETRTFKYCGWLTRIFKFYTLKKKKKKKEKKKRKKDIKE